MTKDNFKGAEFVLIMQMEDSRRFFHISMTQAGKTRRHLDKKCNDKQMYTSVWPHSCGLKSQARAVHPWLGPGCTPGGHYVKSHGDPETDMPVDS